MSRRRLRKSVERRMLIEQSKREFSPLRPPPRRRNQNVPVDVELRKSIERRREAAHRELVLAQENDRK